jgi:hypothetical protein
VVTLLQTTKGFALSAYSAQEVPYIWNLTMHLENCEKNKNGEVCRYIFIRTEENQAVVGKTAISLFSPSAFTFASDLFGAYEAGGRGLGWRDLWDDAFPIGAVMLMLTFDTLLYFTLAWYFKAVLPTQYGSHRPWNFIFKPSYWLALPHPPPVTIVV